MTRYSSRHQEQFFQPHRIRVGQRGSRNDRRYHLVFQNPFTGEISHRYAVEYDDDGEALPARWIVDDDYQEAPKSWKIGGSQKPGTILMRTFWRKREAVDQAKATAERFDWPFDLQEDIVPWAEIERGLQLTCVVCGKQWRVNRSTYARGWRRDACPDCKKAAKAHYAKNQELREVKVVQYGVTLAPGNHYEYRVQGFDTEYADHQALRAMLGIAAPDVEIEKREIRRDADLGTADSYGSRAWIAPMQEWQFEALKQAIEYMNMTIRFAYQQGLKAGSNMIEKLRSGEMHPNDFSDLRDR
ncbi:MAG: hypothetical protein ACOC6F_02965 [bacterium]